MPASVAKVFGGKYQVVRELGKGSSAVVFLAQTITSPEEASKAIKCFNTDEIDNDEKVNLMKEAALLSRLRHPYILRFYDSFFEEDNFFIVTEHCNGGDLSQYLSDLKHSGRHLEEKQIGKWVVQLLLAITFIHNRKLLHRDLKTSNIFLQDGDIRVGDFGICRLLNSTQDLATTFVGTPYYMSPEVLTHSGYNSKSDIWSLGVILYEMCTQKRAFPGNSLIRVMWQVVEGPCPDLPNTYSEELQSLIKLMLIKDPNTRPSANSLLRHPFVEHHMRELIRNLWLFHSVESETIEQQMEMLQTVWSFPDGFFSADQLSVRADTACTSVDEAFTSQSVEQEKKEEIDITTLTPRQRIRMKVHTDSDIAAAEMRAMAEQYFENHCFKEQDSKRSSVDSKFISLKSSMRQLPQERLLYGLRHLANNSKQLDVEDCEDDLFWSYSAITEATYTDPLEFKYGTNDLTTVSPLSSTLNELTKTEHSERNSSRAKYKLPQFWRTYTNLIPNEPTHTDNRCSERSDDLEVKVDLTDEDDNLGNRLFIPRSVVSQIDPTTNDKQAIVDMLQALDKNKFTFNETLWDDTILEDTVYAPYPLPETSLVHSNATEANQEADDTDGHLIQESANYTDQDEPFQSELDEIPADKVQQVIQCMKSALKQKPEDEALVSDEDPQCLNFELGKDSRERKLTQMRDYCTQKMGVRMFDMAYDYLKRKRIVEANQAGEVSILTGLRAIYPDVTVGFVLDQLIFLEHHDPTEVVRTSTPSVHLSQSIDKILLKSST